MVIKFFASIRDCTHAKEINFEACETLDELLRKLCAKYGKRFEEKVFKNGQISDQIIIFINGRHLSHLDSVNPKLQPQDEISIFPVVAGG